MSTTTPCAVRGINGSTASDQAIQPFIDAANCMIGGVSDCTTTKGITDQCLEQATSFLAAHLMGSTGAYADTNANKRETFENYTVERIVGGEAGKGVLGTTYGQTANALAGGCLQDLDKAPFGVCYFG